MKKMNFNFKETTSEKEWEKIIGNFPEANFLQSFYWGEFQEKIGKEVFRFSSDSKVAFQVVKETAKRGNYLSIAGGPLLDWEKIKNKDLKKIIQFIKKIAKENNCHFIRFRPQFTSSIELKQKLKLQKIIPSPMHLTADLTLQLDLTKDEDLILKEMRKNTRYEIRQIEKKDVTIKQSKDPQKIKEFYDHQLSLAKKHGFVPFNYDFLFEQFNTFAKNDNVLLFSSYQKNKLLASAFVIFYNNEAVYHYGISTDDNHRLPGSYACQWAAIKEAKKRGCTKYNFWGIAPKDEKSHRFAGVSLFKRGFGGEEIEYLPAHDIPVSILYWPTYLFELIRKKSRKL
jgi:lipid II:glycine glycyltransferase (peptidoglycan interpeptide bridge formation enzyme)